MLFLGVFVFIYNYDLIFLIEKFICFAASKKLLVLKFYHKSFLLLNQLHLFFFSAAGIICKPESLSELNSVIAAKSKSFYKLLCFSFNKGLNFIKKSSSSYYLSLYQYIQI
jgi:hypothetical protein